MAFFDTVFHKILRRPYKLHVVDHGGHGPVIIFLHGIASSSSNWDNMVPLLKDDYRCVTLDLLGFGESPKPDWLQYTINDHIKSIHKTLAGLRIKGPYVIVGHSMGALLATRYAALHPQKVRRLVLLSPPVFAQSEQLGKVAKQQQTMYLSLYRLVRTHPRITAQNVARLVKILPVPKSFKLSESSWFPFVRSLEQCIENQTLLTDIKKVQDPIDIFYGVLDQFIVTANVRTLKTLKSTTIYPLAADHAVGKRYAKQVAKVLIATTETGKD